MFEIHQNSKVILSILMFGVFALAKNSYAAGPTVYPVSAVAGVTVAYITWTTDIAADSKVEYGLTSAYGSAVSDPSSVTHHALTISGLSANTLYHYRVTSGATQSADYTFTTYANPSGTVRTVGSGKTYATIQSCVNAMSAGDTCLVYSGNYPETVSLGSGSAGGYKTILAQEAATVTGFVAGAHSYSAVKGFKITTGGIGGGGNSSYITIENNYISGSANACVNPQDANIYSWWVIRHNILYGCGYVGVFISGTNILIDSNDISGQVNDCIYDGGLANSVVRNNNCHDYDPFGSGQHLDFFQWDGGTVAAFNQALIEGNTAQRCTDTTGNCHAVILRNPGGKPASDLPIIRYNYFQKIDGGGVICGSGSTDSITNCRVYNNTFALEHMPTGSDGASNALTVYHGPYSKAWNNIAYNSQYPNDNNFSYPFGTDTGSVNDYNIAFVSGSPTASWAAQYASEETYSKLKNLNPTFSEYPSSAAIISTSPAVDAGGALTSVAVGDAGSGTSLKVADARFFQPGWAGTQADWIAVGSVTNAVQIQSIDYTSNTLTLTGGISRSSGQPVWLYKKSDGVRILWGNGPDVGAFEYQSGGTVDTAPAAPTGLIVN